MVRQKRRTNPGPLLCVLASAWLLLSCQEEDPRAPAAQGCGGDVDCRIVAPRPVGGETDPGDLEPPADDDSSSSDAGVSDLTGEVQTLLGFTLTGQGPLTGATVRISGPSAAGGTTEAEYDGDAPYILESVASGESTWLSVEQLDGDDLFTTLQPVDTTQDEATLFIMDTASLEAATAVGGLSNPVTLDPSSGHALLTFVSPAGTPLVDVSVDGAPAQTIAYDAGDTYSDVLEGTGARGTALLLNMPGSSLPGSRQTVTVSREGDILVVELPVARGAISIATLEF